MKTLWEDAGIKECFARRHQLQILDCVAKSVLSQFTGFLLGVRTQPLTVKAQTKHCQIGQLHD